MREKNICVGEGYKDKEFKDLCMPDVVDSLAVFNLLQGYEGLLEQSEKYHSFLNNMPAQMGRHTRAYITRTQHHQ